MLDVRINIAECHFILIADNPIWCMMCSKSEGILGFMHFYHP
jgi:hypothetical protein